MLATPAPAPDQPPAPTAATPAPLPADGDGPLLGLLAGLAREAMRHEPADLVKFARGYFTDLDAARAASTAGSVDAPPPASPSWSPAADAAALSAAALPSASSSAAPPTDDDDVSGALAAILSVGSGRFGGGFELSDALERVAGGDI